MGVTVIGGVQVGDSPENLNKQNWGKEGKPKLSKGYDTDLQQEN